MCFVARALLTLRLRCMPCYARYAGRSRLNVLVRLCCCHAAYNVPDVPGFFRLLRGLCTACWWTMCWFGRNAADIRRSTARVVTSRCLCCALLDACNEHATVVN